MSFEAQPHDRETARSVPVRAGVKALVRSDERVLLVKERHADGTPFWTLPGGGVEPGESRVAALRREVAEELGCGVVVGDSVGQTVYAHHSSEAVASVYEIYECGVCSSVTPNPAEGIFEAQWVSPEMMPARTLPLVRSLWW